MQQLETSSAQKDQQLQESHRVIQSLKDQLDTVKVLYDDYYLGVTNDLCIGQRD